MTREEAKKRAELYSALADGKTIQAQNPKNGIWTDMGIDFVECFPEGLNYRIKTGPKYRPFRTQEECLNEMLKHQPLGWCRDKEGGALLIVTAIWDQYIYFDSNPTEIDKTFDIYEFLDGTPFGIKE